MKSEKSSAKNKKVEINMAFRKDENIRFARINPSRGKRPLSKLTSRFILLSKAKHSKPGFYHKK